MTRWIRLVALVLLAALGPASYAQEGSYDWSTSPEIFSGVQFTQVRDTDPRLNEVFCMRVDTKHPRIRFHTTGRHTEWAENVIETRRTTTRNFLIESRASGLNMVAAINADAFEPWPAPYAERTLTNLRGLAVADGEIVSPPADSPSFVVYDNGRVAIENSVISVEHVRTAISGFAIVLAAGVPSGTDERLAPRTGIGVSKDHRYVQLLVIDGRRHASEGVPTEEVGRWLLHFGAHDGINLDGGGSTTMVRYDPTRAADDAVVLNSPVGDGTNWLNLDASIEREKYVPTERANGNNLGVCLAPD